MTRRPPALRIIPAWRLLAPFAALFLLLIVFAVGGMLVIAREADRSDAASARQAVTRTFAAMLAHLEAAAEMNAAAPPIADALSGTTATPASAYGYLNFTNSDALGYFGTVVLDADGSAFAGTYAGLPWTGAPLAAAARLVAPVAARLPASGAATVRALLRDTGGRAVAVAVANVVPRDTAGNRGAPLRRLAMIAPVGDQLVPKIVPSLGVDGFRMVAVATGNNAVAFSAEGGPAIVFAWRPRTPGRAAIARWAPAIAALLAAAVGMLLIAARGNLAATRALEQLAHHDSLTGLANRPAFRAELDRRLARGEPVVLGMIDLDGFKGVNDKHGHLIGDELLHAVALELAQSAGDDDFVARLGGDEFAWISPSPAAASRLVAAFAARLERPLAIGALRLRVGASSGIAVAGKEATASALMAEADRQLYAGKSALQPRSDAAAAAPTG